MALNGLFYADVPLRNYSLTYAWQQRKRTCHIKACQTYRKHRAGVFKILKLARIPKKKKKKKTYIFQW